MLKLTTILILIMLNVVQTSFAESDLNVDQLLDIIIVSQKAELASIKQGKGSCVISTVRQAGKNEPERNEQDIRFYFKGVATRTDVLPKGALEQDDFLYSVVDSGEYWYRYNKTIDNALVKKSRIARPRKLSEDFHPNVYYGFVGNVLIHIFLDKARKNCDIASNFTQEGLLELTSTKYCEAEGGATASSDFTSMCYMLLDPAHSYRPLQWTYEQKDVGFKGEYSKDERTIQWNDSSDFSYPTSIIHSGSIIMVPERLKLMPHGDRFSQSSNFKVHVEITDVDPHAQIVDETFTLEGMGIKNGTVIDDAITGIIYKYGVPEMDESFLEDMLSSTSSPSETSTISNTTNRTSLHKNALSTVEQYDKPEPQLQSTNNLKIILD